MKPTQEQFEECKNMLDKANKAVMTAETTISVLNKQMENLKSKRSDIEKRCAEELGVPVKELQSLIDNKMAEYIEITQIVNSKYEEISQEQSNGKQN